MELAGKASELARRALEAAGSATDPAGTNKKLEIERNKERKKE